MAAVRNRKAGFWSNIKEIAILLLIVYLIRTFGFGLYRVPTGSMETTMLAGERFFADKLTPYFTSIKNGQIIAFNDPTYQYSKNKLVRIFQDYVWGPTNWTKRVIGIPGDHVKGVIENGKPVVYLNGKKLNEPYLNSYPLVRVWKKDPRKIARYIRRDNVQQLGGVIVSKSFDPSRPFSDQPFYRILKDRIVMEGGTPSVVYPGTPIYPQLGNRSEECKENYWTGSDEFSVKLGDNQFWVMGDNRGGSTDSRWFGPIDGRLIHGKIMYRIWSIDTDEEWWILDLIKHPIDFWRRVRWKRIFNKVI